MKTAIYVEDGVTQLVLTPETAFEKEALQSFGREPLDAKIFVGAFYDCRGGWVRQTHYAGGSMFNSEESGEQSLILRKDTTKVSKD